MREFFDLAGNPLFVKHVRSRLRRAAVVPGVVVIIFLSLCIVFINNYVVKNPNRPDPDIGSHMFFWLQGILLVLMGGSQVASAIAQMKESGIIDFHRITPIPPAVQTIGIMLGAPIRELIMYATTLPFALYLAIDGPIGVTNFAKLLLVQLGSALMYYSLAMITGLTGGKARGASGRFVILLAGLNIMASSFFEKGVYGPTLITSMPVYIEVFSENDQAQANRQQAARQRRAVQQQQRQPKQVGGPNQAQPNQFPQNPVPEPKREVTFYGIALPLVLQSLLFQGSILTFLFIAAARRIHSARLPLYRKPVALLFMITVSALTLGTLWDSTTMPLTLGAVYFLTFFAIIVINTVTPPLGDVAKGLQRARKLSDLRVPIWSDLSSNKFIVGGFALILAVAVAIGVVNSLNKPQPDDFTPWLSLLVGCLTVLTYGFASQYFALGYGSRAKSFFVLFIFFAWIVPIIIGMLAMASQVREGAYLIVLSPLVGIYSAGEFDGAAVLDPQIIKIASIAPVALCAFFFLFLLLAEERRLANEIVDEHDRRERKRQRQDREPAIELEADE